MDAAVEQQVTAYLADEVGFAMDKGLQFPRGKAEVVHRCDKAGARGVMTAVQPCDVCCGGGVDALFLRGVVHLEQGNRLCALGEAFDAGSDRGQRGFVSYEQMLRAVP